jgi:hypothetical protein
MASVFSMLPTPSLLAASQSCAGWRQAAGLTLQTDKGQGSVSYQVHDSHAHTKCMKAWRANPLLDKVISSQSAWRVALVAKNGQQTNLVGAVQAIVQTSGTALEHAHEPTAVGRMAHVLGDCPNLLRERTKDLTLQVCGELGPLPCTCCMLRDEHMNYTWCVFVYLYPLTCGPVPCTLYLTCTWCDVPGSHGMHVQDACLVKASLLPLLSRWTFVSTLRLVHCVVVTTLTHPSLSVLGSLHVLRTLHLENITLVGDHRVTHEPHESHVNHISFADLPLYYLETLVIDASETSFFLLPDIVTDHNGNSHMLPSLLGFQPAITSIFVRFGSIIRHSRQPPEPHPVTQKGIRTVIDYFRSWATNPIVSAKLTTCVFVAMLELPPVRTRGRLVLPPHPSCLWKTGWQGRLYAARAATTAHACNAIIKGEFANVSCACCVSAISTTGISWLPHL